MKALDKLLNNDVERYELINGELQAKPAVSILQSLAMA